MKVIKKQSYITNLTMLFLFFLIFTGCSNYAGGPIVDTKVQESVRLTDEAVKEYTDVTQPLLREKIEAKKEELANESDVGKKEKLNSEITSLEDAYGQGEELPNTTDALYKWTSKKKIE